VAAAIPDAPPSLLVQVVVKLVTVLPPSFGGGSNPTTTCWSPAVTPVMLGAVGTVAGVAETDVLGSDVPTTFVAVIQK
jgi:hypothetical protein